ncbi:retrovirus-related pol polyprotein from transposon TNT 1-94 [Tanacetum coccineum]
MKNEESLNVTFDETPPPSKSSPLVDDDLDEDEAIKVTEKKNLEKDIEDETLEIDEVVNIKESRNHPLENVIRNLNQKTLRLESIRILLAYACALDFKLFQMDIKSAFLNGFINKEVYMAQPQGFIDFEKPYHVYKLKKALYGLKQAPKAWYDRLKSFLIKHYYNMGMVDNTLFTKKKSSNLIIFQIYVDDIIFGLTCQDICDEFAKIMHDKFEMSMMGELNFFLGLQIKQIEDVIFFNQFEYIKEMLKKFGLEDSKPMKTPMPLDTKLTKDEECESVDSTKYRGMIGTMHLGLWYPKGASIETVVYAESDHAGDYVTMPRKTAKDHKNTRSYILIISNEYNSPLNEMLTNLENHYMHEGRVVYSDFDDLVYVRSMFSHIGFECLLDINEKIIPHFILKFYSQYRVNFSSEGQMLIEFVIQNQFFSYTIEEFGQILGISSEGACSFSNKWSLDDLQYSVPTSGPYQTNPPCPDGIKNYIQEEREGPVTRVCHGDVIDVEENQILTHEIRYNLAFFVAKRMEFVTKQARLILPYGMLLTRLFNYVISESPELSNDHYILHDRVMYPLTAQQEQKIRKDYGTRRGRSSTSSLFAFGQPSSSSHPINDDNDGNDEGTSRASTLSPTRFVNSLSNDVPQVFSNPPNIDPDMEPFYTRQTEILNRQLQLRDEQRGGIRSIGKGIKNLWKKKKK